MIGMNNNKVQYDKIKDKRNNLGPFTPFFPWYLR